MRLESWPGILIEIDWHGRSVQIPLCIGEWAASDCLLYEFNMFVQLQLEGPCPPFDGLWLFCNTSKQLHCWAIFFPFWMHRWPTTRTIKENQILWTSKNLCGISRWAVKCRGGYYGKIPWWFYIWWWGIFGVVSQYFTLPHLLRRNPPDSPESSGLDRNPEMSHIVTWWFCRSPLESAGIKYNKVDCSTEKGVRRSPPESTGLYSDGKSLESTGMGINSRI